MIEIAHHHEQNSPEILLDYDLGALLASVGNHETKAATLIAMEPGSWYTAYGVSKQLHERQEIPMPRKNYSPVQSYLNECFVDIGVVAKVQYGEKRQYTLTEDFGPVGQAIAGHLLKFSLDHPEISLKQLLGMTHSTSESARPPIQRVRIFEYLVRQDKPSKRSEMTKIIGMAEDRLANMIEDLESDGIVETKRVTPKDRYEWLGNDLPVPDVRTPAASIVMNRVIEQMGISDKPLTVENIMAEVIAADEAFEEGEKLYHAINTRVNKLVRDGCLRKVEIKGNVADREVWLREDRRQIVSELLDLTMALETPDEHTIEDGLTKARSLAANPQQMRVMVAKGLEHSPQANSLEKGERISEILTAFNLLGDVATIDEVTSLIARREMTRASVSETMKLMKQAGILAVAEAARGSLPARWTTLIS